MRLLFLTLAALTTQVHSLRLMVVGANGKTGAKVVETAAKKGIDVTAVTRSGTLLNPPSFSLARKIKVVKGDVTAPSTIILKGMDAVVFCASASKEGGTAQQVDRDGCIALGKMCIESRVPRYVIVSSGATSKPWSPVYLFLNLFGGIMKAKAEAEQAIQTMYKSADIKLGYTIVKPGGLTEEEPLGVRGIELNQLDEKSGRVSRWDVAEVCVEAISNPSTSRVTMEVYNKDTGKPLSQVGLSNILKLKNDAPVAEGEFQRRGTSWKEIFKGLVQDKV